MKQRCSIGSAIRRVHTRAKSQQSGALILFLVAYYGLFAALMGGISALLFVVSMVPDLQLFLQKKEPAWLLWVPVSGEYTLLTRALRGDAITTVDWLQSAAAPLLLTSVALLAAARLLRRQEVFARR